MKSETYSATLCDDVVDKCSEKVRTFLKSQKLSGRDVTRYALTLEEILLKAMTAEAEPVTVTLSCDTLLDFICTGFDQYLLPFAILNQAGRLGLVNRELLTAKKKGKK